MSSVFAALLVTVIGVLHAAPALAQSAQYVGRAKCVNCHDHDNEKLWSEKKDGPPPKNHLNALKQMESDKSKGFAAAIGLKDVYDVNGACVRCHATVLKGNASGGVTCETCHGPGSLYLEPHQKKDSYKQSVTQGLNDVVKNPKVWAPVCVNCHIMDDQRLIAAKHPSGDDFELGAKFSTVADGHWKSKYEKGEIAAAGKAATTALLAKRMGKPAAQVMAAPPAIVSPAAPPPAAPPQQPAAPPPAPAPPAPVPVTAPPVTTSLNPPPSVPQRAGGAPPAIAPPPPAPLPAPPRAGGTTANPPAAASTSARSTTPVDTAPPRRPVTPPVVNSLPPVPPAPPPIPDEKSVAAAPPPPPAMTPVMAAAEIQGRTLVLLNTLLVRGTTAPVRVTPPEASKYSGVESELLQLQREVLSLAIEALATPPPVEDKDKQPKR